jgi:hypothetical protein
MNSSRDASPVLLPGLLGEPVGEHRAREANVYSMAGPRRQSDTWSAARLEGWVL